MRWPEFRDWSLQTLGIDVRVGWGGGAGGTGHMGRVLDVGPIGTGKSREYGIKHQRRLWAYHHLQQMLGPWRGSLMPRWIWEILDVVEEYDGGYLVLDPGKWWRWRWHRVLHPGLMQVGDQAGRGRIVLPLYSEGAQE